MWANVSVFILKPRLPSKSRFDARVVCQSPANNRSVDFLRGLSEVHERRSLKSTSILPRERWASHETGLSMQEEDAIFYFLFPLFNLEIRVIEMKNHRQQHRNSETSAPKI